MGRNYNAGDSIQNYFKCTLLCRILSELGQLCIDSKAIYMFTFVFYLVELSSDLSQTTNILSSN